VKQRHPGGPARVRAVSGHGPQRRELLERGAQLAALWGFAVAQPLFQLLGGHPEFFGTRASPSADIVVLAFGVAVLPLILLVGAMWLAGLVSRALAWGLQLGYVAALAAAIALQALPLDALLLALAVGAIVAAGAAVTYARSSAARSLLTVLSPAPIVFLAVFLLLSDVSPLVLGDTEDVQAAGDGTSAPVVLVIFDELPVHSLMTAERRIDARRFPNFARLAGDATWYRDTTSVDQDTPYATPAILDGRLPRRERLPVAADHPQNIFTLLGNRYELHVREDGTALCPPRLCAPVARESFDERMRSLSGDVGLAYAHLVLPDRVERELPAVTRNWRHFADAGDTTTAVTQARRTRRESKRHRYRRLHANLAAGRPQRFEEFVDAIEGGSRPRLHLIHILLPHVPFQYLPSGHRYRRSPREALPGLDHRPGYGIRFLVNQSYERHLLQLQATDRLLGRLLDRLHAVGIYDQALVAVVADHGISFRLGHDRRLVRAANVEDIAPVPFFVKAPGQRHGRVSDKPLRTIDVLPTLADILGLRMPWRVDGLSARVPTVAAQRRRVIIAKKFRHVYVVDTPAYKRDKRAALARKQRLFGDHPYAFGPRRDLVGRGVAELAGSLQPQRAVVVGAERYQHVDPDSGFVPTNVVGRIEPGRRGGGRLLAVGVNGTVAATGRTFTLEGGDDEQFSLLIPERTLRPGFNRLVFFLPVPCDRRAQGSAGCR
jgi:sulfatase-like protein